MGDVAGMKPGRNDRCPCGSGKKFKHCCEGKALLQAAAPSPTEFSQLVALYNTGRHAELESQARVLLEQYPDSGFAWKLLGVALLMQGKAALPAFQKSAELLPDDAEAHYNLGVALKNLGLFDDAVTSYRHAIKIKPDYFEAHSNLGNTLKQLDLFSDAVACYRRALKFKPDSAEVHYNLGNTLIDLGQLGDAEICFRRAIAIQPDFSDAHSNLLLSLNYTGNYSASDCLAQARQFGHMVARKVESQFTTWLCATNPKRLRVGLVSGDLREHSVGHFLENLLTHIDPTIIELIAYPTQQLEDALTARIKPHFAAWKPLFSLNDKAASQLIHADGVHVLIDLAGHTRHNRLQLFAWKPAPVQSTWLGYFATTGMTEMDYIIGDKWMLPDEESHHFVEKSWRLSGAHSCLTPPQEDIEVEKLPALQNQFITFGSLNNPAKMNARVVACWARILSKIPNSRLYLNARTLRDDAHIKSIIKRFSAHGISENRLILESTTGRAAALNSYNRIDIALDPFPYPGGTTSYEALWMGVPILTMQGSNYISHLGESIMHNAGLADWVAMDVDDYVAKAVFHTDDLNRLANLRAGLRQRVLASPLFDAQRFARSFEEALWRMWQKYQADSASQYT